MLVYILSSVIILYITNRYFSGGQFNGHRPDLSGKYAVVTGGNSGIGEEVVKDLAKQGCRIMIGARDTKSSERVIS